MEGVREFVRWGVRAGPRLSCERASSSSSARIKGVVGGSLPAVAMRKVLSQIGIRFGAVGCVLERVRRVEQKVEVGAATSG